MVAGAVILPRDSKILYLNDSKQLTAKKRDELYDVIMREAVAVGIGYASPARIDEINILQATYEAMREAISKLSVKPDVLLNDAVKIPQVDIRQVPIIKGDAKSVSIAAASIVAKVTRDTPDGRVRQGASGLRFCIEQGLWFGRAYRCFKRNRPVTDPPAVVYRPFRVKAPHQKRRGYRI